MKKKKQKKLLLAIPAAILIALLAVLFTAAHDPCDPIEIVPTQNPFITEYGGTLVSAHRSGGGIFPENTMTAFEGCINSPGFQTDIFEFDLHMTKDGELIVLHDDTLDRTTDSEEIFGVKNARPEDYTLEELRKLNFGEGFTDDAGNTPYRGLRGEDVPNGLRAATLSEVLDYLEANGGFRYIIEIKNKEELGRRAADALHETLRDRGLLEKTIVGTFNADVTRYIDEAYPDMQRSASVAEALKFYLCSRFGIEKANGAFPFRALQIPANQYVLKLGTTRLVNYAHRHDIAVQYWTINDAEDIAFLKSIGADCVMSDVPDLAYNVIHGAIDD